MFYRCIVLFLLAVAAMAEEWPTTVEDVAAQTPERLTAVLDALDLSRPDLEGVRAAAEAGEMIRACEVLLAYYRGREAGAADRIERNDGAIAAADAALNDTFTFYEVTATVPRLPGGGLDWTYLGPTNDREWALALNRHFHLGLFLNAWRMTGDPKYAQAWNDSVKDWILANPYPGQKNVTLPWRGLEAFFRVKRWAEGFKALQNAPELDDATRILLLGSIPDHAHYLRTFHQPSSNWITMELNGLATAAVTWPEFRDSAGWLEYSVTRLQRELAQQVYPDGVQQELTSHYHWVTLLNFEEFAEVLRSAGHPLPAAWDETIANMYGYLAYTLRPDGYGLLNNDSDRDFNRDRIIAAADRYERSDWRYIATNGTEGTAPEGPPSHVFPWAGQLVMRDGYGADAQWAFFDAGPLGAGHWHRDKLHLSVAAYGRDILVDGGRYTYVGGPWRDYFTGTASHNTILIDGKRQRDYTKVADHAIGDHFVTTDAYDAGYGMFDAGYDGFDGAATHERAVYYRRGAWWLVLDRVKLDRPTTITALWNFHPACTVAADGASVVSTDGDAGNVRVVPSANVGWNLQLVRGQETPEILGWYSVKYNRKEPMTTARYEVEAVGDVVFAWVIIPARGVPGAASVAVVQRDDGMYRCTVTTDRGQEDIDIGLDTPLVVRSR